MIDPNNKIIQLLIDNLVRLEESRIVEPELCERTHRSLIFGICPWCGLGIERGMKPSEILVEAVTRAQTSEELQFELKLMEAILSEPHSNLIGMLHYANKDFIDNCAESEPSVELAPYERV
jgi:hypothetical protein